jgi:hypothetical protein
VDGRKLMGRSHHGDRRWLAAPVDRHFALRKKRKIIN